MRRHIAAFGVLVATSPALAADMFLKSKEVTVEGVADLAQGEAAARDAAIRNAQRNALETVLGAVIETTFSAEQREAMKNNQTTFESSVKDRIYSQTAGYIESQEVVGESKQGTTYRVTLKVVVKAASLADELKQMQALLTAVDNPKIALLIVERYTNQKGETLAIARPSITAQVEEALLKRSIQVVAKDQIASLGEKGTSITEILGNDVQVAELVAEYGADVAIVGSTEVKFSAFNEFNDGMYYLSATVNLRAVNAATTKVLASVETVGKAAGVNEDLARVKAANDAAPKVIDTLIEGLVRAWRTDAHAGKAFKLVVYKVKNYAKMARPLIKEMEKLPNVTGVKELNFGPGRLELEVTFRGTKAALLDSIFDQIGKKKEFRKLDKVADRGDSIELTL